MSAPSAATPQVPRVAFGLVMAVATALALGIAAATSAWLDGSGGPVGPACVALLIGSVFTLAPVVLRISHHHWGLAVMVAGVARGLVAVAAAFALVRVTGVLELRPLVVGVSAAAMFLLIVETAAAITILSRLDRAAHPSTPAH